jgi:hypothetical protein
MNQNETSGDSFGAVAGGSLFLNFLSLFQAFRPQTLQLTIHGSYERLSACRSMALANLNDCSSAPLFESFDATKLNLFAVFVLTFDTGQDPVESRV